MSENIFKEIYSKVLSLFKQTEKEDNAKDIAKNRLRVVLMQDRTNLTPELLQRMRKELIELLSKYVEMDKEALELNFDQEGDQMALMLSIPVIRAKEESEIVKELDSEEDDDDNDSQDEENEDDFVENENDDVVQVADNSEDLSNDDGSSVDESETVSDESDNPDSESENNEPKIESVEENGSFKIE